MSHEELKSGGGGGGAAAQAAAATSTDTVAAAAAAAAGDAPAAAAQAAAKAGGHASEHVSCPACTYNNRRSLQACLVCGTALPVEGTCSAPHEDLESARAEAQRTVAEALPGAGAASGTPAADPTGARGGAGVGAAPAPLRRETSEDRHSAGDLAGANDGVGAAEVAAALESLAFLADAHGGGFDPYEGAGTSDAAVAGDAEVTVAAADEVKEGEEEEPASGAYVPSGRGLIPAQLDPTGESARSSDTGAIEHGADTLAPQCGAEPPDDDGVVPPRGDAAAEARVEAAWACKSCTFVNAAGDQACVMCGEARAEAASG